MGLFKNSSKKTCNSPKYISLIMTFSIQSLRKIELEENVGKSYVHFLKCF